MAVSQLEVRWVRNGFKPIRGEVGEECPEEWLSTSQR